jgi:phosphatidate cytidylyltransferase|uniref:Phosphatidate cytidylyltransferase n=1 Tax=Candidatus Actinomarina minuta TaxID=1389454 RepID=S5DQF3_9ACTN|nr:CDP-diglyceride synthetase [Candidatus Actinomarina minuta]
MSDNEGTFWPGYIELPEEENLEDSSNFQNDKNESRFTLNPRIYTGLGLLLLVAVLFLNQTSAFILLVLVALISTKEWFDIFDYGIIIPYPLLLYSSLAPLVIAYFYGLDNIHVPLFIFPIGVIVYTGTFVSYGIYEKFGSSYLFLIWFGTGIASIGYVLQNLGPLFTFLALISISLSDIAAYEFGKRYGKRKLSESISPNKTIEGFFAGLLIGSLSMFIVLNNYFELDFIPTLLVSLIFILFGVLGDLFESRIKRTLEVKDSSDFLPGHGGVLDRVDSQILSFPVLVLFIQFLDLI